MHKYKLRQFIPEKTEVIWTDSVRNLIRVAGKRLSLGLNADLVNASNSTDRLGVTIIPDLIPAKHASTVGGRCFFQLFWSWQIRCPVDSDDAPMVIYAFVTSCVD